MDKTNLSKKITKTLQNQTKNLELSQVKIVKSVTKDDEYDYNDPFIDDGIQEFQDSDDEKIYKETLM